VLIGRGGGTKERGLAKSTMKRNFLHRSENTRKTLSKKKLQCKGLSRPLRETRVHVMRHGIRHGRGVGKRGDRKRQRRQNLPRGPSDLIGGVRDRYRHENLLPTREMGGERQKNIAQKKNLRWRDQRLVMAVAIVVADQEAEVGKGGGDGAVRTKYSERTSFAIEWINASRIEKLPIRREVAKGGFNPVR